MGMVSCRKREKVVVVRLLELSFSSVFELTKCSSLNIGLLGDDGGRAEYRHSISNAEESG